MIILINHAQIDFRRPEIVAFFRKFAKSRKFNPIAMKKSKQKWEESSWKCNGMVRMNKPSFIRSQEIETFSGSVERGGRYDIIACKRKRDILCHQNK